MSDFNIQFEEQDQVIRLEFEQAGGGAVKSVNGKTGVVVLDAADVGAYVKPSGGIPKTDLASSVQTSLGKADSAYQKPSGGIPASDMASGAIPTVDNTLTTAGAAADAKKTGDEISDLKDGLQAVQTEVAATLITDTASGSIASFPDGADGAPVKSLTVDIEPVQDLHGQDNPYPAGGGKNKILLSYKNTAPSINSGSDVSYNAWSSDYTAIDNTKNWFVKANNDTSSSKYVLYYNSSKTYLGYDGFGTNGYLLNNSSYFGSTSYVRVRIDSPESNDPKVQLEQASSATAYAPYSNICPISGWTQGVISRTGINIWDEAWEIGGITDGTGAKNAATDRIRTKNYICVKPSFTYYFVYGGTNYSWNIIVYQYDKNKNYIGDSTGRTTITSGGLAITATANTHYMLFQVHPSYGTTYNDNISINYPSTDHDYHSGTDNATYTISLNGTRYGGSLDVGTGVLTVDRGYVDLVTLTWSSGVISNVGNKFYSPDISSTVKKPSTVNEKPNLICSQYPVKYPRDFGAAVLGVTIYTNGSVQIFDESYVSATVEQFKTAMSGVQLVYELAEPFTVQLTAQDITTLKGQNNIWSDAGTVNVEYRADTKLYIEKLTAPTEDDMIADHAISANSFFMVGNTLYRATTAIASGATITVGTNATRLSLADALNTLS